MKPLKRPTKVILSLWLITLCLMAKAQSSNQEANPVVDEKPYEIATYMGANRIVNLMIMVRCVDGVTIRIRNAENEILHELYMKRSLTAYHYKLNFENSQAGQYKLEISDGRTRLTRRIEVVDVPATEAQRYITFTSPVDQ